MRFFKKIKTFLKKKLVRERLVPVIVPFVPGQLLKDKVALVSGGSSGIGFGIAKKMAESGCKVIISGTNEQKLRACAADINGEYLVLDIRNVDEIRKSVETLTQRYNIDILVNSAGVRGAEKFGEVTEETWNKTLDINIRGLYFLSQVVANHMKEKKIRGHILNISSASSLKPSWTPYEISKRAVDGITQGMAQKLIPCGIVVNGLAPGPTATPMLNFCDQANIDLSYSVNPSKRVSTVEEIANLALFMVSDFGNGIVGDTVFMTGGSGTVCIDE
jgi:3-oxoacyl-[acyl-carrier protein] reductase